jgi:hypothetical protein
MRDKEEDHLIHVLSRAIAGWWTLTNVLEERDAPGQIVIGAMDRRYCILLALGIYLEAWMESKSEPQTGIYLATLTNSRSVTQIINQMSSDVPV